MFGWFSPKCPLSADEWEWQLAAFKWLDETVGLDQPTPQLVTPTVDFFPRSKSKGKTRAEELLKQVQSAADMNSEDWPVRLEMQNPERAVHEPLTSGHAVFHAQKAPAGTFRGEETEDGKWRAVISLAPTQLDSEVNAIATLAHEMSHYLLATVERSSPGGKDCHELLTDLTAVYLGFGIFMGNSAHYSGHSFDEAGQWFRSGWQGYLSERALMTALAIQEARNGRDPDVACRWLKPYLSADVRLTARYIAKRDIAADILAVDLSEYGVIA